MNQQLDDDDWDSLLDQMVNRHVLPVIGLAASSGHRTRESFKRSIQISGCRTAPLGTA
jgi:hypothetical protein